MNAKEELEKTVKPYLSANCEYMLNLKTQNLINTIFAKGFVRFQDVKIDEEKLLKIFERVKKLDRRASKFYYFPTLFRRIVRAKGILRVKEGK